MALLGITGNNRLATTHFSASLERSAVTAMGLYGTL